MLQGDRLNPGFFLDSQLHVAATSFVQKIVIGGLVTPIERSVGIDPNPNNRIPGSGLLNLAAFEQMKFRKVEAGQVCWIYPGNYLMPLLNIDRTTFLNQANLYFLPGLKELV